MEKVIQENEKFTNYVLLSLMIKKDMLMLQKQEGKK